MNDDLHVLYGWVRRTRETVFDWTASLPPAIYTAERPEFAVGSLRTVQAHAGQCYLWWTGHFGLGLDWAALDRDPLTIHDVAAMRAYYRQVDEVVAQALATFADPDREFTIRHPEAGSMRVTRRWLLMHPLTHEFHHKGQMLAMGRTLGHPFPAGADTDLVPPV
ncbi:MAG: DinB family protein [Vicinamibacterales bacterium]